MKLSLIFEEKPVRWGLRGDPYFWDYLKEIAEYMDFAVIEQFAHGGMSSGGVDNMWWTEEGIPMLKDRLDKLSR